MKKVKTCFVVHFLIAIIGFLLLFYQSCSANVRVKSCEMSYSERLYLISLFQNSGFKKRFLKKIFLDKRLKKNPLVIKRNIHRLGATKSYSDFHSSYYLNSARKFSETWAKELNMAYKEFGVDKEILVSLLLIETNLGNILGKYPIVSVFSSILLENHQKNYRLKSKYLNKPILLKRLALKADMAIGELRAFLVIIKNSGEDPFLYKGSFAGAFGIPQFLPGSYLKWGSDGDEDGLVNLFMFPDAIFSAANYLKAHGWKRGLRHKSNRKVIWLYNRSYVYADNVLRIAQKLSFLLGQTRKLKRRSILVY